MTTTTCHWCARPTTSRDRVCQQCVTVNRRANLVPADDVALTGGRWVLGPRRVLVWEVDKAPLPPEVAVHELIACPVCNARIDQTCKTATGHTRSRVHPARIVSRRCPCGGPVQPRRTLCQPCARENARESQRIYVRRKRAVARDDQETAA